jgi:hypothetical protein
MPRRQLQADIPPYTKVLSALLKTDLLRLCVEFHLPTDGSVVALRLRLKDYLNMNRDTLYRNPRYNALFPRHRRPTNHQLPPLVIPRLPASHTKSSASSPALSYVSLSPALSYASWNGIEDQLIPPQHPVPGQPHVPAQHLPPPHQPLPPHDPHDHLVPPPSPSIAGDDQVFLPPAVHAADGRKFYFSSFFPPPPFSTCIIHAVCVFSIMMTLVTRGRVILHTRIL